MARSRSLQVSKLDLIIDTRVAREVGIKVPQELLFPRRSGDPMSSSSITVRRFLVTAATAASLVSPSTKADPSPTMVRIGALVPPVLLSPEEGLRQGLRELGYV